MVKKLTTILAIAGTDNTSGAGIQADIKTITTLGGYAASVITAVTSQNTQGVQGIHDIPLSVIKSQIKSVIDDIDVRVIKTGMLNNPNLIKFIELRTHDGAQWEIQQVARACLSIVENLWPIAISSYREIRGLS